MEEIRNTDMAGKHAKGFTLIELLITVSIVGILSVLLIIVLNPAQLLKQSRDSHRLSDMINLKKMILMYSADAGSLANMGTANNCYASAQFVSSSAGCFGRMSASTVATTTAVSSTVLNGGGWIPINFSSITYGLPLSILPVDPVNNTTYFYSYATNANLQFELDAKMESTRYSASGTNDVESTDGGNNAAVYETGSNLTL